MHHEVEYQLDLCRGLSIIVNSLNILVSHSRGGEDEANILTEFYSQAQKPKESEETFADELQLLAHKVISNSDRYRVPKYSLIQC